MISGGDPLLVSVSINLFLVVRFRLANRFSVQQMNGCRIVIFQTDCLF